MNIQAKIDYITITSKHEILNDIFHPELSEQKKPMLGFDVIEENDYRILCEKSDKSLSMVIFQGQHLDNIRRDFLMDDTDILMHIKDSARCTRIDLACDIYGAGVTSKQLETEFLTGFLKPRTKLATLISDSLGERGDTFYLGSLKTRQKLFRGYEKSKQQSEFLERFRLELQLGKEGGSIDAFKHLANCNFLEAEIVGAIRGFLNPTNESVLDNVLKADIVKYKVENSHMSNTQKWLLNMVIPVIRKEFMRDGSFKTEFFDKLLIGFTDKG